ncbi:hypothetical protein GCM10025874_08430 [Arenivirga flava]|uniref:Uncharacterized protein n=1 Tax=Arenivirga flava TaxID=1930060 RepID=A0AA37UIN9_9MICO|nr:hypothetical protein GCM10025874_08430 [Arenivirga flava]
MRRHEGDVGPAIAGRLRERDALATAGAVADEADGIDGLAGAAGGHEQTEAGEIAAALEDGARRLGDLLGFGHTARARVAAGELPDPRADDVHAALPQQGDVRDGRRVLPHLGVHGRSDQQRGAAGQHRVAQQVVGDAVRELGDGVGRRRCDDDEVGVLAERDVAHLGDPVVEVRRDRIAADRLEGRGADEAQRRLGGDDLHIVAREHEGADRAHRLVGGDAAGHADDDARSAHPC